MYKLADPWDKQSVAGNKIKDLQYSWRLTDNDALYEFIPTDFLRKSRDLVAPLSYSYHAK